MLRPRLLAATLLLVALIVPTRTAGSVYAAAQVVWHLDRASFSPGTGQAAVTQTFTAQSAAYLVEVELSSANPGDEVYIQLGDNQDDVTQVRSGEDRFFTASNLKPGTMPAFRIIADPKHQYAGRMLTYAAAVYTVPPTGTAISGVAVSAVPNVIAFRTPRAAAYTVHYRLDSGAGRLLIINAAGATVKDFGSARGEGAVMVSLPAGIFALGLEQQPEGSSMNWTLSIGLAPRVGTINPTDRAQLSQAPGTLWAATQPNAQLVLDNKTVAATYDAASARLVYHPAAALAAGLHLLAVAGADGTQATAVSHFLVLSAPMTPAATAAGSIAGLALTRTTTPDGRYRLLKPAAWHMAESGGTTYVADPRGKTLIMLSDRYLGRAVDARSIVHTIGDKLGGAYGLVGAWTYGGSAASATLGGTLKGKGRDGAFTIAARVLPSLDRHSLLIAYGFGLQGADAPDAALLRGIMASLSPNAATAIVAARPMLRYAADVVTLEYPAGWLANFTDPRGSWFIGPSDQAVLIALGITTGGVAIDGPALRSIGEQVQGYVRAQIHAKLQVVQNQASPGRYRWLALFAGADGQMNGVEVGEIVAHNGKVVAVFGDTTLDQAPTNLPLFAHSLDSAALAAGVTPDGEYSIDQAATALRPYTAAASSDGRAVAGSAVAGKKAGRFLIPFQKYLNAQASYQSVLDSSYGMYAAEMNVGSNFGNSGISYSYTSSAW